MLLWTDYSGTYAGILDASLVPRVSKHEAFPWTREANGLQTSHKAEVLPFVPKVGYLLKLLIFLKPTYNSAFKVAVKKAFVESQCL